MVGEPGFNDVSVSVVNDEGWLTEMEKEQAGGGRIQRGPSGIGRKFEFVPVWLLPCPAETP